MFQMPLRQVKKRRIVFIWTSISLIHSTQSKMCADKYSWIKPRQCTVFIVKKPGCSGVFELISVWHLPWFNYMRIWNKFLQAVSCQRARFWFYSWSMDIRTWVKQKEIDLWGPSLRCPCASRILIPDWAIIVDWSSVNLVLRSRAVYCPLTLT